MVGKKIENICLQLYTVRTELEKDFERTLEQVAKIGYKEVEFFDYYGHSPGQIRAVCGSTALISARVCRVSAQGGQFCKCMDRIWASVDAIVPSTRSHILSSARLQAAPLVLLRIFLAETLGAAKVGSLHFLVG